MKNKLGKSIRIVLTVLVGLGMLLSSNPRASTANQSGKYVAQTAASGANLLINGNFDHPAYPFYWRPTNHYVAGMWYQWFYLQNLPEFIDGGIPHHNTCYPDPAPGQRCTDSGNRSQGYIRWGAPFVGGIYQLASVTPCAIYRFEVYNRNDAENYNPRVGIDPLGQNLPMRDPSDPHRYPFNCPPDGLSECPKPYIMSIYELPQSIIWSDTFDHGYYWAPGHIEAEARSSTIGVWTYVAPEAEGSVSRSTYWDNASLVQIPFPNGRLPGATSDCSLTCNIRDINTVVTTNTLTINWRLVQSANTQIWYSVSPAPQPITPTLLTHTTYLPIINRAPELNQWTPIQYAQPALQNSAVISGLQNGQTVTFVVAARTLVGDQCVTEISEIRQAIIGATP